MSTKPSLSFQFDSKRPTLKSAPTKAVFQTSTVTWSDPNVTWSDPVALWGGSDSKQRLAPKMFYDDKKPALKSVKTKAQFKTTDTTWSDPAVTWNSLLAFWGGSDPKQSIGPSLFIENKKPILSDIGYSSTTPASSVTLYGGMPMGLLMALTYDQDYVI